MTVIQLPGAETGAVTPSPYAAIQRLESAMQLRGVDEMRSAAICNGFTEIEMHHAESSAGKRFAVQVFTLPGKTAK